MTTSADQLFHAVEASIPVTRNLVAGVAAHQWTVASPCEEMDVLGLVRHLIGGLRQFADVAAGKDVDPTYESDVEAAAALDEFESASADFLAAWSDPAVVARSYAMPWGETPGSTLLGFMVIEEVTHGWDLARATGQTPAYDDEAAGTALRVARENDDPSIRVPGMFGPVVAIAGDAPVVDQVAAFLGRNPADRPAMQGSSPSDRRSGST